MEQVSIVRFEYEGFPISFDFVIVATFSPFIYSPVPLFLCLAPLQALHS